MNRNETDDNTTGEHDLALCAVAQAGINTPQEMTEKFIRLGLMVPPEVKGYWILFGEVPAAMFDSFFADRSLRPRVNVSYCRTSNGGTYLVITHQVASWQHRFLLPLWDSEVMDGVRAMRDGRMKFMLASSPGRDAAVIPIDFEPGALDPAFARAVPTDVKVLEKFLAEMPGVIDSVRALDAIPGCLEMATVTEASLSVVVPLEAALAVGESMLRETRH